MESVEVKQEQPVFSPLLRRYTLQEFWALPEPEDRFHYDLIGGHLFLVPPPDPPHGRIDSRLDRLLVEFLLKHEMKGEVFHPHEPIYTSATYLEPDMMYVSEELRLKIHCALLPHSGTKTIYLIVFTGPGGFDGSFTGCFSLAITSAMPRSNCGSRPSIVDFGSLSTSMSGSTP